MSYIILSAATGSNGSQTCDFIIHSAAFRFLKSDIDGMSTSLEIRLIMLHFETPICSSLLILTAYFGIKITRRSQGRPVGRAILTHTYAMRGHVPAQSSRLKAFSTHTRHPGTPVHIAKCMTYRVRVILK